MYLAFVPAFVCLELAYKGMERRKALAIGIMVATFGVLFAMLVQIWGILWAATFAGIGFFFAASRILISRTKSWQKWHVRRALDASVIGFIVMFSVCKHGNIANQFPREMEMQVPQARIEHLAFDSYIRKLSAEELTRRHELLRRCLLLERLIVWQWCLQSLGNYVALPACLSFVVGQTIESARKPKAQEKTKKALAEAN
ncbi:MAG TPA: hypothetical protein V6C81_08515 [Planktothrix sp.]